MASAPRPGRVRNADTFTLSFTIDGVAYTLYPEELTAADASAVRRATRKEWGEPMSLRSLLDEMVTEDGTPNDGFDLDVLAVLAWLARRQQGDSVSLRAIAESITYSSDMDFGDDEAAPEDASAEDPLIPSSSDAD